MPRHAQLGWVLLLLLGCPTTDPATPTPTPGPEVDPLTWPVAEAGPYQTGYSTWESSYTDPTGAERIVQIHLWYPTEETDPEGVRYLDLQPDEEVQLDATPADPVGDAYPALVYSHGHQGWGTQNAFLMRHLASHGWVGIAPDHAGNTLLDNISPRELALYLQRPADISHAIDVLADTPPPLGAPVATDRVVLAGHSFGAHTTWAVAGAHYDQAAVSTRCGDGDWPDCEEIDPALFADLADPRVVAALPLAGRFPEDFAGSGPDVADVAIPMLQISGSEDAGAVAGMFERGAGLDFSWVDIEGGCHQVVAMGGCSEISTEIGWLITQTYAFAFARHQLLDDQGEEVLGILSGAIEVAPEASFQRH